MKTIILAIDICDINATAIQFGAALAAFNKSKLILVNAIPVQTFSKVENSRDALPSTQLELYFLNQLIKTGQKTRLENGYSFKMEALCVYGPLMDNLNYLVRRKQATLVIMVTKGTTVKLDSIEVSNTINYLRPDLCPVLIIPVKGPFKKAKLFVYTSNIKSTKEEIALKQLFTFAAFFCLHIDILNISEDNLCKTELDQKN